ncbi:YaaC-like Protein [Thermoactinomyces sp. DSM 45891]|uniref:YaaC family protein n=1 Tax=Thermoactinomyces sp. DSM 45891 TaxID=1761907 RepID=UPI0009117477|nr:YaaC family protein [Thermoactinomyces sp. DSM 45891]SFX31275.1 YaaC-like Protein [Thermoactinomyces sp. DSM 45891]
MKVEIYTESPERAIWGELAYFENELIARDFLKEKYSQLDVEHPDRLSFRNVTPFLIYIRQARQIFQSAHEITNWMKPTHLYYGMMSLLKALILTVDPFYPQNSHVLKHGISTKKKKKELFRFFYDDIRVQKDGLFPHYQALFSSHYRADYSPIQLMQMIPDIQDTVYKITQYHHFLPVVVEDNQENVLITLPDTILEQYKFSRERFVEWLNSKSCEGLFRLVDVEGEKAKNHFQVTWSGKQDQVIQHPYLYQNKKGDYFVWIRNNHLVEPVPEMEAEYLLLFSLSMLSRYEPPLWAEVMDATTSMEGILIQELLHIVQRKFPNLMLNQLHRKEYVYLIR